jgi:hypothetical protein
MYLLAQQYFAVQYKASSGRIISDLYRCMLEVVLVCFLDAYNNAT